MRRVVLVLVAVVAAGCAVPESEPTPTTGAVPSASAPTATPAPAPADDFPAWASAFAEHVEISVDGDVVTIRTDAVPRHEYGPFPDMDDSNGDGRPDNPNTVRSQSLALRVPRAPAPAATPGTLPLGPIGIAITGSPFFDARNAEGADAVEVEVFDACNGHPEMRGVYHYHQHSPCFGEDPAHGIVGVSLDGYAIHALDDAATLDACNGHEHDALRYHYHLTSGAPYTMGCYHGSRVS